MIKFDKLHKPVHKVSKAGSLNVVVIKSDSAYSIQVQVQGSYYMSVLACLTLLVRTNRLLTGHQLVAVTILQRNFYWHHA
jgi:hypothetical protein